MSPQEETARKITPFPRYHQRQHLCKLGTGTVRTRVYYEYSNFKIPFCVIKITCVCLSVRPPPRIFFFLKTGSHNAGWSQTRQSPESWVFWGTACWLLDLFISRLIWHTIPIKFSFSFLFLFVMSLSFLFLLFFSSRVWTCAVGIHGKPSFVSFIG